MSKIHSSDKRVCPGVWMSLSAIYQHDRQASAVADIVVKALPVLKRMMKIPADVTIRIAPIKARSTNGRYFSGERLAVIDCRLGWKKALEVLCHEMVHAEQYHTGRLANNGYAHYWNGQLNTNRGTTYSAYRNQPWEEEAFGRQAALAAAVLEELGE